MTVLLAGSASIGHFFSNFMYALWLHPEARKAVRSDTGLIDAAVEEGVRWDTSTQCFARHLTAEVTIAGTTIPAQSRVILFYGSANRDERATVDPDRFDIRRPRVRHFGWGFGTAFLLWCADREGDAANDIAGSTAHARGVRARIWRRPCVSITQWSGVSRPCRRDCDTRRPGSGIRDEAFDIGRPETRPDCVSRARSRRITLDP